MSDSQPPPAPAASRTGIAMLVALALLAFAGNSLLCRMALRDTSIDPAGFTVVRLLSGAAVLAWLVMRRGGHPLGAGSWPMAIALFAYAAAFSFAYLSLSTGTGALLLFGSVQLTMLGAGLWQGERPGVLHALGLAPSLSWDARGLVLAVVSGALTSGVGYALWYRALPHLGAAQAGGLQLSVPLLAALMGSAVLAEPLELRFVAAAGAILGGIGLTLWRRRPAQSSRDD